ncbi:radical SAM family heme chaperone HemW [Algoriphagus sp. AK58]|uniref:radical SAM family heme chaperone HemW n=1 Tax=Algoriphagus sp. AK58 TaxID=1406877 RepID=UPI001650C89D|nr:radical SAM family heme chaperone HemW [Algoriphagus sp. AK58]MBC6366335.1 coproporphyrinogen III oxidase [Algoriphagus sp. AK58]
MAGIYIHIPFCRQACHYCDFHFTTNLGKIQEMTECILREIEYRKDYLNGIPVDTVYFGGGTPSLLPEKQLETILGRIFDLFPGKKSEITLEANPDDLKDQKISAWKSMGIDRLSLGIQSFQEEILKAYNRTHTVDEALKAIRLGRKGGFEKFSIDLIYGFPFPDHSLWQKDLEEALRQDPGHISAYALTVEPKTALGNWASKGRFVPADEDFIAEQFEWLQEQAEKAGYIHYEISNLGKPGKFSLHNSNYWKGIPYLGIGPSAHSFDGKNRGYNPSSNAKYTKALLSGSIPFELDPMEQEDRINEEILTGLRTIWGLDTASILDRHHVDLWQIKSEAIKKLESEGWLIAQGKVLSLTRKGKLLADSLAVELFI